LIEIKSDHCETSAGLNLCLRFNAVDCIRNVFKNAARSVSRTGSAYDWCALQEALYKCIDSIQYNDGVLREGIYWHHCQCDSTN